jgi:hypothetical protein
VRENISSAGHLADVQVSPRFLAVPSRPHPQPDTTAPVLSRPLLSYARTKLQVIAIAMTVSTFLSRNLFCPSGDWISHGSGFVPISVASMLRSCACTIRPTRCRRHAVPPSLMIVSMRTLYGVGFRCSKLRTVAEWSQPDEFPVTNSNEGCKAVSTLAKLTKQPLLRTE